MSAVAIQAPVWLDVSQAVMRANRPSWQIRRQCRAYLAGNRQGLRCLRVGQGRRSMLLIDQHALDTFPWADVTHQRRQRAS